MNVGKHLYRMNAVMGRCEQLQDEGEGECRRARTEHTRIDEHISNGRSKQSAKRWSKKLGQHGKQMEESCTQD